MLELNPQGLDEMTKNASLKLEWLSELCRQKRAQLEVRDRDMQMQAEFMRELEID